MQGIEGQVQGVGASTLEIEVERGPLAGQRLSLQGELRIGSGEGGPGTLNDPWLSPTHALVYPSAEGWVIEDQRSVEGTRVSGRPVRGATTLRAGDTIELGSTRLVVLPDGLDSLADTPERQAERRAADLQQDNRRSLDVRRVLAVLLDGLLVAPLAYLVGDYAGSSLVVAIAVVALDLTYFFVAESMWGQTLGKKLFGLRTVRRDGHPLTPQAVGIRTVLRLLETNLLGLLVMVLSGRRRQRLGDLAAGTVVTKASYDPPRAPMRGRNLIALLGYPLLWLAPAVIFYVTTPAARAQPCDEAGVTSQQREGTCIDHDGRVYTVVNLGHTLHMSEFDAELKTTAVRRATIAEAARHGFPSDQVAVVGFKVSLKNTTRRRIVVDRGGDLGGYMVRLPTGKNERIGELPARIRGGFVPFGGRKGVAIAPGRTRTGWVRFALPDMVLGRLDLTNAALELRLPSHEGNDQYIGQFRLWRAVSVTGAATVVPLKQAG